MQDYKTIRSVEEIDAYIGNATIVAFDFETAATLRDAMLELKIELGL